MKTHEHMLAECGGVLAEIVLPKNPTAVEIFAGVELEKYLRMMSSSKGAASSGAISKTVVLFERTNDSGRKLPPDVDGFEIASRADRITISGNRRGLLYAVYELLELLGARFCFPGEEEAFPVADMLKAALPPLLKKSARFPYRGIDLECLLRRDKALVMDHVDWMGKNRFNMLCTHPDSYGYDLFSTDIIRFKDCESFLMPELEKRGIVLNMNVHTTNFFLPPEKQRGDWYSTKLRSAKSPARDDAEKSWCAPTEKGDGGLEFALKNTLLYFKQPVDFTPLMPDNNMSPEARLRTLSVERGFEIPSQICYSNKDAVDAYCANIMSYLGENPAVRMIGLWPADGGGYCDCARCAANPQVIFEASVRMAEKIKTAFPEVVVEHLLYAGPSLNMPDDSLKIPSNMVILQAGGDEDVIDAWFRKCEKSGSVGMYKINYKMADNFYADGHVCVDPGKAREEFDFLASRPFLGHDALYIDMYSHWRSCQNLHFFARLAWNDNLKHEDHIADFCEKHFGRAAATARNIYTRMTSPGGDIIFVGEEKSGVEARLGMLRDCAKELADAISDAVAGRDSALSGRLEKLRLYIAHLVVHAEIRLRFLEVKELAGKGDKDGAARALVDLVQKEERMRGLCLDSHLRGDGVLDYRLTLLKRKLSRFPECEKIVSALLES